MCVCFRPRLGSIGVPLDGVLDHPKHSTGLYMPILGPTVGVVGHSLTSKGLSIDTP